MVKNTSRLELFRQAINNQADAEAEEISRQTEETSAALEKEKRERTAHEALSEIKAERSRIASSFKKEISRCDYDMKRAVLSHRNDLTEQFFAEMGQRLSEWTKTPAYAEYLKTALAKAEEALGSSGTVIHARHEDTDAVRALTRLPVEEDSSITIGGISAEDSAKGLFADFTLDSGLAGEKAAFPNKSELRL